MKNKKNNYFVILYGGSGKIGVGTIDLLLRKDIFVINIDPNDKNYKNKNVNYYSISKPNLNEAIHSLKEILNKIDSKLKFLGIVNFSRINIKNNNQKLSLSSQINADAFRVMIFDFVRIIDELLILNLKDFSIIHVSSLNAFQVSHQSILYHCIKGAIESLNKSMAYKLASKNIRSNVIVPALVNQKNNSNSAKLKIEINSIPLKRGAPNEDDIGKLVFFLLSRESLCITGSSILIDSGMSLPDSYTVLNNFEEKI